MKKPISILTSFVVVLGVASFFFNDIKNLKVMRYPYPVQAHAIKEYMQRPPTWATTQIREDLDTFRHNNLSYNDIENAYEQLVSANEKGLLLVNIENGKISYKCNKFKFRPATVIHSLKSIHKAHPLPNTTFILSTEDCCSNTNGLTENIPIFTFAKDAQWNNVVLFPDNDALKGRERLDNRVNNGMEQYPWKERENTIFWRGAANNTHRINLLKLSNLHTDRINAKVTGNNGNTALNPYVGSKVSVTDHLNYKYLIDIDGNSCTYSRMYWILYSNSVLLKHKSNNVQWYYKGLIPNVHYVDINSDLSNLVDMTHMLDTHNDLSTFIAHYGSEFAKEHLSNNSMAAYIIMLLTEYDHILN